MIDLQTKIHDKFTLEFKVGFIAKKNQNILKVNDFVMNTWIFVPNSLDINKSKYSKENFYRDIKSGVRLITPSYKLHDLANDDTLLPWQLIETNTKVIQKHPENKDSLLHAIKMYCAITKSATRGAYNAIAKDNNPNIRPETIDFLNDLAKVLAKFRQLKDTIGNDLDPKIQQAYTYGDEFLSNIMEQYGYRLREFVRLKHSAEYQQLEPIFKKILIAEKEYKSAQNYLRIHRESDDGNSRFVYHASLLKKFAESDLFLQSNKSHNTFLIEQIFYSVTAGIAMLFATVTSFFFQQKYGNFTFPFLVALVISYMFKDRIKDLLRMIFAKRLSSRIYDTKTVFRINKQKIGWSKDSFDFVENDKVPEEVLKTRQRTQLFDMVSGNDEKIILYRKKVQLHRDQLAKASPFPLNGINDNIRFNITEFLRKMDNPNIPLQASWEDTNYSIIIGKKVYYIHFVIQCSFEGQTEYKHIVLACNRDGIVEVKGM